jgi:dTDP-4-dehydrorhamnose 3,5-epimerase
MVIEELELPGVLRIQLDVYKDERGWFQEFWNLARVPSNELRQFVQDNVASSNRGVLRGLHFQHPHAQGKLVTPVEGSIFDIAVDLRPTSSAFGRWISVELTAGSGVALYIPPGFAHGYQVLSETAHVLYKATDSYHPDCEHTLLWNDTSLGIPWPIAEPVMSAKDRKGSTLPEIKRLLQA